MPTSTLDDKEDPFPLGMWRKIYNQMQTSPRYVAECKLDDCNVIIDKDNYLRFDSHEGTGPYDFKLEWQLNNEIEYVQWTQAKVTSCTRYEQQMKNSNLKYYGVPLFW